MLALPCIASTGMRVAKSTVIIVAVCAAVVALILLIFLLARRSPPPTPFPPVQPLAHHREQQLAMLAAPSPRPHTWYSQDLLHPPQPFGSISPRGSRASLLAKNSASPDTESANSYPIDYDNSLPLPSPSFHPPPRPASSSSVGSSDPGSSPRVPPVDSASPPPTSTPSPARRPRPLSRSSSHSTVYSKASRNTLRGTPHSRHSQIQIILPTPLSPELASSPSGDQNRRMSRIDAESYDRRSIVDRWVSVSTSVPSDPDIHDEQTTPIVIAQPLARRVVSNPTFSPGRSTPPVPRVPSMYISSSIPEAGEVAESDGRPRKLQRKRDA